jgi:hypothetical protein
MKGFGKFNLAKEIYKCICPPCGKKLKKQRISAILKLGLKFKAKKMVKVNL